MSEGHGKPPEGCPIEEATRRELPKSARISMPASRMAGGRTAASVEGVAIDVPEAESRVYLLSTLLFQKR
jgi:hypothetical protein